MSENENDKPDLLTRLVKWLRRPKTRAPEFRMGLNRYTTNDVPRSKFDRDLDEWTRRTFR